MTSVHKFIFEFVGDLTFSKEESNLSLICSVVLLILCIVLIYIKLSNKYNRSLLILFFFHNINKIFIYKIISCILVLRFFINLVLIAKLFHKLLNNCI